MWSEVGVHGDVFVPTTASSPLYLLQGVPVNSVFLCTGKQGHHATHWVYNYKEMEIFRAKK